MNPREIHLKADKGGEIDVLLCPEASSDVAQPISDPLLDDIKPLIAPLVEKFLSPRLKKGKHDFSNFSFRFINQPSF